MHFHMNFKSLAINKTILPRNSNYIVYIKLINYDYIIIYEKSGSQLERVYTY